MGELLLAELVVLEHEGWIIANTDRSLSRSGAGCRRDIGGAWTKGGYECFRCAADQREVEHGPPWKSKGTLEDPPMQICTSALKLCDSQQSGSEPR